MSIDGPKVNVDFYSAPNGCNGDCDLASTPVLAPFTKRESFGYSLNGKEFLVAEGQPYTVVHDGFSGTKARILGGVNGSTTADAVGRPMIQTVNTGWSSRTCETSSEILSLWGMATALGSAQTSPYALSMSYDARALRHEDVTSGTFGLATRDGSGHWVNAADMNIGPNYGGARKFVAGPWSTEYTLGTYGVDVGTHTVWAVVNYDADFAATKFPSAR